MTADHQLECISSELSAYLVAEAGGNVNSAIRAYNRLLDTCIDAGMDRNDEPHLWAAPLVSKWLASA